MRWRHMREKRRSRARGTAFNEKIVAHLVRVEARLPWFGHFQTAPLASEETIGLPAALTYMAKVSMACEARDVQKGSFAFPSYRAIGVTTSRIAARAWQCSNLWWQRRLRRLVATSAAAAAAPVMIDTPPVSGRIKRPACLTIGLDGIGEDTRAGELKRVSRLGWARNRWKFELSNDRVERRAHRRMALARNHHAIPVLRQSHLSAAARESYE